MPDLQPVIEEVEAEAANVGLLTKSEPVAGGNPKVDGFTSLDFYDANDMHVEVYESSENEELIPLEQGPDGSSEVGPGGTSKIIAATPLHADDGCDDLEGALEKDKKDDLTLSQDFERGLKSLFNISKRPPKSLIHEDERTVDDLYDPLADSKDLDLQGSSAKDCCINSDASLHRSGLIAGLNNQQAASVACDSDKNSHIKGQEASSLVDIQFEMVPINIRDIDAPKCLPQTEIDSIASINCEKYEFSVSFDDTKQEDEFDIEMVGDVVEPVLNSVVTQSGHIVSTNFLEEMIEDAKNNKVIMALDCVI